MFLLAETQSEPVLSTQDFAVSSIAELYETYYAIIFVILCKFLPVFKYVGNHIIYVLHIKFMFVCCLKLCLWNEKKEKLSKPFIKIFTPLLFPYLIDREHHQGPTDMCLCVSLYCGQMLSVCFILVSADLSNETDTRLKMFTLFSSP